MFGHGKAAFALMALLVGAQPAARAAPEGGEAKPAKVFAADAALGLTLTAPWRDFMRNKRSKQRYPGTLEFVDDSGTRHSVPAAFQARGINRLKVCDLPPIKLIFDKDAVAGTPFRGNKSLKLVTHCGSGERWEQYTIREMLAYRIYNLVTERSFRVRPVAVTYADSGRNDSDGPHFGFLIEDDSELAKRNGLNKLDTAKLDVAQLEALESSRFALFEYLIGNTDWAVLRGAAGSHCCHNAVLVGTNLQANVYAVPYDFDSSGLVDAHYAVPSEILHVNSVRDRVFRGFCAHNATLETARAELLRLEPQVMELVREDGRLAAGGRQSVADYLSKGFEVLRDDAGFAREVTAKCRK